MTEKAGIERATAENFLSLYNARIGTDFVIIAHAGDSDDPDFQCRDTTTKAPLTLEITLLEDRHGDIPYLLGRGTKQGPRRNFIEDTLERFRERITDKCMKDYGPNAALVLRQVTILWTIMDWEMYLDDFQRAIPARCQSTYKKGIWVLTWEDTPVRSQMAIVQLV